MAAPLVALLSLVPSLANSIGGLIDKFVPDPIAAQKIKDELPTMLMQNEHLLRMAAADIVKAEAQSEGFLTRSWRPITMLTFLAVVVAYMFGFTAPTVNYEVVQIIFNIIQVGLGGYVVGRSAEKIVPPIVEALKGKSADELNAEFLKRIRGQ